MPTSNISLIDRKGYITNKITRNCVLVRKTTSPYSLLLALCRRSHVHQKGGFESLGLCSEVYGGGKRWVTGIPTPIQRKTMPMILSGADVVAMAQTCSGKTAAFLISMLQKLRKHVPQAGVRTLILSPTRDLAIQTLKFTKELGRFTG